MASVPPNAIPRSVKTCTECRQAKLRCDSKDRFPNSCSRCESKHLFCNVDATFKRTPAKKRFEAMSRELQELRSRKDRHGSQDTEMDHTIDTASSGNRTANDEADDDFEFHAAVVSLGDLFIEPYLAVQIFKTFANLFRPKLPITGPLSISRIYDTQPLLFWTIIAVVVSRSPRDDYSLVASQLEVPYTRFLREQILEAPLPLYRIRAILLICEWPLGVTSQTSDPSWLYCGTAIHAARFMSLDRQKMVPSLRPLGVAAGSIQARINTWLGCFYVSTSMSVHLGLPAPIDSDLDFAVIQDFLRQSTIPPTFATRIRVQLIVAKFTALVNRDIGEAVSSSFVRLLDAELAALRPDALGDAEQSRAVELCILDAKLHFYTLFITKTPHETSSREIMLRTALSVALRIIHVSTAEWHDRPELKRDPDFIERQRSLPKNHYRGIALATAFLLKFFHHDSSSSPDEKQLAANHISLAGEHFRACSTAPHDEYSRTARLFEVLARSRPGEAGAKKLRFTHRMGVSIVLNAVLDATEVRGRPLELDDEDTPNQASSTGYQQLSGMYEPQMALDQNGGGETGILRDFWNDPILSMMGFDPPYDMPEY